MIKEINRFETSFGDGTYWVEYKNENGRIGYEIIENENEKINPKDENKILIEEFCSKDDIDELRMSENDMWFIEYDDEDFDEKEEMINKDIEKYPFLKEYITFESDCIALYGGMITEILF